MPPSLALSSWLSSVRHAPTPPGADSTHAWHGVESDAPSLTLECLDVEGSDGEVAQCATLAAGPFHRDGAQAAVAAPVSGSGARATRPDHGAPWRRRALGSRGPPQHV